MPQRILIAGLGNELCGDDGVGVYACRLLAPRVAALGRDELVVAEIGTAVQDALHLLEQTDYVLAIDAMQAGGPPGSIYLCEAEELAAEGRTSLHQLGLLGALELLALEHAAAATDGSAPATEPADSAAERAARAQARRWRRPRVEILGVEPESLELGLGLSRAVQAALPRLLEQIWQQVNRWLQAGHLG